MAKLLFHGQATFTIETTDGTRIVIDPYFDDSPFSDRKVSEVGPVDYILVTHGHEDHFADVVPLARASGAQVVASYEIVEFLGTKGITNCRKLHIGGGWNFPFGRVKMTPAVHGGAVHGDETGRYTTQAAGLLVEVDGKTIYHAGDTGLTMDMKLLEGQVDVAILPIGDSVTMGPVDAVRAVDFIKPDVVIPMHYSEPGSGVWPLIAQDPEEFRSLVGDRAKVVLLKSGDTYEI